MKKHTLYFIFFIFFSTATQSQVLQVDKEKQISSIMKRSNIHGLSISIISNNKISYSKGFGKRNKREIVTTETLFQAASLSKMPTALLLLVNQQNKIIDIDKRINQYLNSHKLKGYNSELNKSPTIRQLLNHTGGINLHGFLGYKKTKRKIPTIENVIDGKHTFIWEPKIHIKRKINSKYFYSGGGYSYLEKMIKDLKNEAFSITMRKEILTPLKINASFYGLHPGENSNFSNGYLKNGKEISGSYRIYPQNAAAGLWSNPKEYSVFLISILNSLYEVPNSLLPKDLILKMLEPSITSNEKQNLYGLGVGLKPGETNKIENIYHDGQNFGFSSYFNLNVIKKNGYVIFSNKHKTNFNEIIAIIEESLE